MCRHAGGVNAAARDLLAELCWDVYKKMRTPLVTKLWAELYHAAVSAATAVKVLISAAELEEISAPP